METDFETKTKLTNALTKLKESSVGQLLEQQAAKASSSNAVLYTAAGAMAVALALKLAGKNKMAFFVGQWATPILVFGIYNKLVKGHDTPAQA